jgi:NTE family protein
MRSIPDVLVLGGGGRQGDAWMTGVLAGLEEAHGLDLRDCDYFVGTSAGSIVAAKLAAGRRPRRPDPSAATPEPLGAEPAADGQQHDAPAACAALALLGPFASLGLQLGRVPGEALRAVALALVGDAASEVLDFGATFDERFDGRLRVAAVQRRTGRRVVFGAPGAPDATVAEALTASCALPRTFPPARIGGHEYVDGAVWSPTNADVAPASREAHVLVLAPMSSMHGPFMAGVRLATRAAMLAEAAALRGRGAHVRLVTPDERAAAAIGVDLMASSGLAETHAAGYAQGLRL